MRKWMSEKLKRRKKTPEETAAQPAPLQPAFYDTAPPENPPAAKAVSEPISEAPPPVQENDSSPLSGEPAAAPQSAGDARRPRRRRGRGGRGRRSPGQRPLTPAAPADASVANAPVAVAVPAPQRPPKGVVVLAVGLPGSGKSSWVKRPNISPRSNELLRSLLFDDPSGQR